MQILINQGYLTYIYPIFLTNQNGKKILSQKTRTLVLRERIHASIVKEILENYPGIRVLEMYIRDMNSEVARYIVNCLPLIEGIVLRRSEVTHICFPLRDCEGDYVVSIRDMEEYFQTLVERECLKVFAKVLKHLKMLNILDCTGIDEPMFDRICEISSLEYLKLVGLNLVNIGPAISRLKNLKRFEVDPNERMKHLTN